MKEDVQTHKTLLPFSKAQRTMDHYTALPSIQNPRLIDLAGSLLESSNIDAIIRYNTATKDASTDSSPSFFSSFSVSNDDQIPSSTLMVATHQLTKALHLLFQHKIIDEKVWSK